MLNNTDKVLNILMSDKTIAETLNKIISGQYVTDRERKDGMADPALDSQGGYHVACG